MNSNYTYYMPTKLEVGADKSKNVGELISPYVKKKVFIITDEGIIKAGLLADIFASMEKHALDYEVFDQVEPNPNDELVKRGLSHLEPSEGDVLLAVGGGSSIDTAKAIALMATNEGDILDYEGSDKVEKAPLSIISIPTTAGTGSEVTASTVITNSKTFFKAAIVSPYLYPDLAIVDPSLTLNCPPSITASTGMDALTHAIESYVSKQSNPISQALALQAIKMIKENLPKAYLVGNDMESRSNMLEASMIAGFAFSQTRLGNVHAISHSFGGIFNIPHGIANATILPFILHYNIPACPEKMKNIAKALGANVTGVSIDEAANKVLEEVVKLNQLLDIPSNVKELGVDLDKLPQLVKDSMNSGNILTNPRLTRASDVEAIIESAYHGNL
ncbi:iron-containing alcohol dehydrogenase [Alteribacillus sp. JSM 102045]|uniref:iron-containing alcohol dehydrogenase n=1 Tax=Alteribacillus sp. JSM 102045 TaxID=1562101 RepID=UPI0035C23833